MTKLLSGGRRPRAFLSLLFLGTLATTLGAVPLEAQRSPRPLSLEMSVQGMVFDNFFGVSDDAAARQIGAAEVEVGLVFPLDSAGRRTVTLGGSYADYATLGPSPGANARFLSIGRTHIYDLRATYEWDRPYYETIDFLETADMARVLGRYVYRPGNTVQLKTLGLYQYYWFDQHSTGNGAYGRIDGSVRVRALGYWLFPEVGGTYGMRTTVSGDTDFTERHAFGKITVVPFRGSWLVADYRLRMREYSAQDPTNPNFEREDEHGQWTFAGALPLTSSTTLKVTYGFLDADSDVPLRVFTRQMLILGLEWKP